MSIQMISSRLDTLKDNLDQLSQLIQRLHRLQPYDPITDADGSTPDEIRADLSAEIHDSLKHNEEDLELLEQDVEDLVPLFNSATTRRAAVGRRESEREREHAALQATCERLRDDIKITRSRFRKAQLQAKANAELAARAERAAYLSSLQAAATNQQDSHNGASKDPLTHAQATTSLFAGRRGHRKDPNATQADLVLTAQSDITAGLKRNHALMASELSRARFAQETLDESNRALEELNVQYGSFDDLLAKSRGLLGTLLRSQKSDTWYLETAMWLLMVTVGWLVFRRLLYGPLWWLVWLPIKFSYTWLAFVFGGFYKLANHNAGISKIDLQTREPLKVMPSATGGPPKFNANQRTGDAPYIRAGAGGSGAKDKSPPGSLSDMVGSMVEEASAFGISFTETAMPQATEGPVGDQEDSTEDQNKEQLEAAQQQRDAAQPRRAPGEPLRERDSKREPPNPKKRMMEEPIDDPSQQREL